MTQAALDVLWDFADPVASEAGLRAVAEGADGTDRAVYETQVARALGLQERYADAEDRLDRLDADDPLVQVRILLERGRLRNSAGDADAATVLFQGAAELATDSGALFLLVDALHMLAISDPANASVWTASALAALDDVEDERTLRWTVSLHNNAGWRHFDEGRFADAAAEFAHAREAALRWGTPQQVEWADEALAEARTALAVDRSDVGPRS